jgi:hypothetical protein
MHPEPIDPNSPLAFERTLGRLATQLRYVALAAKVAKVKAEQGLEHFLSSDLENLVEAIERANVLMQQVLNFK